MNRNHLLQRTGLVVIVAVLSGCASPVKPTPYDYSAFRASRPASILVLPPINNTPDIAASYSVLSHTTRPLAEAGYYVLPVTVVVDAFKENGVTDATEIHATEAAKLRSIFGADAVLYLTVNAYGSVYNVIRSTTTVEVAARLVDLRTDTVLWEGSSSASSAEKDSGSSGNLAYLLLSAVLTQVIDSLNDKSDAIAEIATGRLLQTGTTRGLLPGPRAANPAAALDVTPDHN